MNIKKIKSDEIRSGKQVTYDEPHDDILDLSHYVGVKMFLVSHIVKIHENQWARDDLAFIIICNLLLAVSALAYSVA
ncbi:hypothetical protein LguiA_022401 [Lonicera macranthoides]